MYEGASTWMYLRGVFDAVTKTSLDAEAERELQDTASRHSDERHWRRMEWEVSTRSRGGFQVPIEVRNSPGKGRGVFAASDIPSGSTVWITANEGRIYDGNTYRRFLSALPHADLRCDAMMFTYLSEERAAHAMEEEDDDEDDEDGIVSVILVNMDEAALMNADWESSNSSGDNETDSGPSDEVNVEPLEDDDEEEDSPMRFIAARDIRRGEELICDYPDYVNDLKAWSSFKLGAEEDDDVEEEEKIDLGDYSGMTLIDFWKYFDCETQEGRNDDAGHPRPTIYQASTWYYLRGLYAGVMRSANGLRSTDFRPKMKDPGYVELSWNATSAKAESRGFRVPIKVSHTRNRGRGVFATNPIRRDELVCVGGDEARFTVGDLYRAFLLSVPTREMRCDIIQFSYFDEQAVSDATGVDRRPVILVALSEEAYLNADWTPSGTEANIVGIEYDDDDEAIEIEASSEVEHTRQDKGGQQNGRVEYVATRDIAAGEELVLKYIHFLYDDGWRAFGL
jgi:hypothetical protein